MITCAWLYHVPVNRKIFKREIWCLVRDFRKPQIREIAQEVGKNCRKRIFAPEIPDFSWISCDCVFCAPSRNP